MWLVDSLVVIGLSTLQIGTIHDTDGVVERTFCLRNAGMGISDGKNSAKSAGIA